MKHLSELSQHQKILMHMCRNQNREWWLPQDFMGDANGDLFVGYEASARLSELANRHPEMIDSKPDGKYKARRINFKTMQQWLPLLPKDLRYVFHRAGLTAGMPKPAPPITEVTATRDYVHEEQTEPPRRQVKVSAEWRGFNFGSNIKRGEKYDLELESLVYGQPVKMIKPFTKEYKDLAAFQRDWKQL